METNNEIYAATGNEFESANCHDIIDAPTIVISLNRVTSFLQIIVLNVINRIKFFPLQSNETENKTTSGLEFAFHFTRKYLSSASIKDIRELQDDAVENNISNRILKTSL